MKKILIAALTFCSAQAVMAQRHLSPADLDKAIANKAAIFTLKVDKAIVETNDRATVQVQIQIYDHDPATAGPNDPHFDIDYDYDNSNPASEPYAIQNWKILERGSGTIVPISPDVATFNAPATIPAAGIATVSVEMIPKRPGLPKIILQQVIYIETNPTSFYFNAPAAGIIQEKYVYPSGNQMDQLAAMKLPAAANPAQQAKMAALQQQLAAVRQQAGAAAAAKGFNADALMSNAKAIYVADADITTIQIMGMANVSKAGQPAGKKNVMITLTFPGQHFGQNPIKASKKVSAHIIFADNGLSFGCANDPEQNPKEEGIHCAGGTINITSYTQTEIMGTVHAQLEGYTSNGTLDGKFKVKIASL